MGEPAEPQHLSAQKYQAFLEALGSELARQRPGVFEIRYGKPSSTVVDGLMITKPDVAGYVFVTGFSKWPGGCQGGVLRRGATHEYAASIMAKREWELPSVSHWSVRCLESRCSQDASAIVDWLIRDWAYERPWISPPAIDRKAERKRLQKIVLGWQSRGEIAVVVDEGARQNHGLTTAGEAALNHDLDHLLPARIRECFPSDNRGRLALQTTILLASYDTAEPPARDRQRCLAAVGPQRRADAQEIRLCLQDLIPANQDHRWESERWRWHAASEDASEGTRWGSPVPMEAIAEGTLSLPQLMAKSEAGKADEGERAALAILLQEEGRLLDAMQLFGVEIDEAVKRLCGGQKIYPPASCAYADQAWVAKANDWMRACAPWLLKQAVRREAERIADWAAEKKGRKRRLPLLKLLIFPGQHHSRKACLMLTSTDMNGRQPRIEIQATASNVRLHESGWKRPLEIDIRRYQL